MAAIDLNEYAGSVAELTPSIHVATIAGELDVYSADRLRGELAPLTARDDETLIVDLSGVTFIDSTALGVLTGAAKLLRTGGGRLVLVSGDPRFRRLLEITGLLAVLRLEPSLTDAVENHGDDAPL